MPYLLQGRLNLRYDLRGAFEGFITSAAILAPSLLILTLAGASFTLLPVRLLLLQLAVVSLPEEAFFRGFLQQRLGNDLKGVIVVSALFAITHLPAFLLHGDVYSVLTFFPSLVMGYLYMRRSNILPSIIFHFFANVVFMGITL